MALDPREQLVEKVQALSESIIRSQSTKGFSPLFLFLYQCITFVCIPVYLLIHLRQGAPINRFIERLGLNLGPFQNGHTIWFHAASLGEVKQIQVLAQQLMDNHNYNVVITTFTKAGADWVATNLPNVVHKFAPIDLSFCVAKFVSVFKPHTLAVIEGDIWPSLLHTLKKNSMSIALLNARSSKSRKRFKKFHFEAASYFDLVTCPDTAILDELTEAGFNSQKIKLIDSLKASQQDIDDNLATRINAIAQDRKILSIASTHESDEAVISQMLQGLKSKTKDNFIIWAPRHLRRASIVSKLLDQLSIKNRMRSEINEEPFSCDALILDTLGELPTVLSVSDAVYLGGGLGDEGGHNPFEPAHYGKPIASGPHVKNHRQAFDALAESGVIIYVTTAEEILNFFTDDHSRNSAAIKISEQRFSKSVFETLTLIKSL